MVSEHATARTLGAARILIFGLWLVNVHVIHLEDLGELPVELLSQHGVLRLMPRAVFEAMVTVPFGLGLRAVLTVLLGWILLGLPRYQLVAIATAVLLTLFDGLAKSLGHINHAKFAMLYAAWILAAFPAADALRWPRRPTPPRSEVAYSAPMIAIALVICTAYMFVGAFRFDEVGFEIFTSDTLDFWFIRRNLEHNPTGYTLGLWMVEDPRLMFLAKAGFAGGTLLEILSPLCLFNRTFRLLWAPSMVVFHFANLFTMNIDFWHNSLLVLFFLTDMDRWLEAAFDRIRGRPRP